MSAAGTAQRVAPLTGSKLAITSLAIALGTFMQVLDTTIANVSLPTISGDLGASTDQGTWMITSFAVANGVSVPLTGWLMGRYGVVRTFLASVFLFTIASFLCGIAWNLGSLIVFRLLQGAVSGPMMPGSQTLLMSIFPDSKRTTALGIWSMTTLVAPICGPILGGYISDNYHWSWIFFINVPVGIIAAFLCWRGLAGRETPTHELPIDTVGLGLLVLWVGALQVMLDTGKDADWFASPQIVLLALVALVSCVVWVIWEMTAEFPVVDLRLFAKRNFTLGTIAFCLGYAVFFANVLLMPLWQQTQLGYTATWAGMTVAPGGLVAVLLTPFIARFMARYDARWIATLAFLAFALSYYMRALLTTDADFLSFVLPMLVQGVAISAFFVAMLTISLVGVEGPRIASAAGISNFARITGGAFAASIVTTLWDRREALHQSRLVEGSSLYNPVMRQAMSTTHSFGLTDLQGYSLLLRNVVNQAYLLASLDIFWASTWISLILIVLIWLARRSVGAAAAGGE